MLSYPFFSDQPGLARRCREFGLAEPLAEAVRETVTAGDIHAALERMKLKRDLFNERLAEARNWELAAMAGRPAVIERILDFA